MSKINWKLRFNRKNVLFIAQTAASVVAPVLAYFGMTGADMTTWATVGDTIVRAVSNPYVVGLMALAFFNATTNPITPGVGDTKAEQNKEA